MSIILCNVFTSSMLDPNCSHALQFEPLSIEAACSILQYSQFQQAVGHPATCDVLSSRLGLQVHPSRKNVRLASDDVLIVAQVVVPRLAEGEVLSVAQVEALPIIFWKVFFI